MFALATWQELPPERGTILELHSTGSEEYDGILAEFYKIDQETGQYFVEPLDQTVSEGLRIKPKCCRRLSLKSLEVRAFLMELVFVFAKESCTSAQELEYRCNRLLRKDPCCVPAHLLLSASFPDTLQVQENKYKHHRRGIANLYAYEDILPHKYILRELRKFSRLLTMCDHPWSAVKNQHRAAVIAGGISAWSQASNELFLSNLYLTIKYDSAKDNYPSKSIDIFSKATHQVLNVINFLSRVERESRHQENREAFADLAKEVNTSIYLPAVTLIIKVLGAQETSLS